MPILLLERFWAVATCQESVPPLVQAKEKWCGNIIDTSDVWTVSHQTWHVPWALLRGAVGKSRLNRVWLVPTRVQPWLKCFCLKQPKKVEGTNSEFPQTLAPQTLGSLPFFLLSLTGSFLLWRGSELCSYSWPQRCVMPASKAKALCKFHSQSIRPPKSLKFSKQI